MRSAIRHLKTSRLSRKDIAEFAGITPPLVSYYFPDRNSLIEAATLPIVRRFAEDVGHCLAQDAPPERVLWDTIEMILGYRLREGAIIDAYANLRKESASQKPDPLSAVEQALGAFFEEWLKPSRNGRYYAWLCRTGLIALCQHSLAACDGDASYHSQLVYQIIVCVIGSADAPGPRPNVGIVSGDYAPASAAPPYLTGA